MNPKLVEIYRAKNSSEAYLLRDRLADEGIEAFVTNDMLSQGKIDLLGWPTDPCVLVREPEAARARQIAEAFEQDLADGHPAAPAPPQEEIDQSWPLCPQCGARRMTTCPACHYAGTDFQPGDSPFEAPAEGEEKPATLVICPSCDEPFTPEYLPRCEWCGHVFDPEAAAREPEPLVDDTVNSRVGIVMAILAVLAAGLVTYLVYLFSTRPER